MRKILAAVVAALLVSTSALAADLSLSPAPLMRRVRFGSTGVECGQNSCKVLSAVALNDGTAANRTFKLLVGGLAKLTVQIDLTRLASTDVQLACTASLNSAASYGSIMSTSVSSGAGTVTAYHDVNAGTASRNILLEYDVRTYDAIKCVLSGTAAASGDLVTVYAVGAVGQ